MDDKKLENLIATKDFYVKELEILKELHKIFNHCYLLSIIGFVCGILSLIISIV